MDILGIKYFGKGVFKYMRGTAREGRVIKQSVEIIRKNIDEANSVQSDFASYDMRKCARNALWSVILFGVTFCLMLGGVFWCLEIGLTASAIACLAMSCVFGLLIFRAFRDYNYITEVLLEKNRG